MVGMAMQQECEAGGHRCSQSGGRGSRIMVLSLVSHFMKSPLEWVHPQLELAFPLWKHPYIYWKVIVNPIILTVKINHHIACFLSPFQNQMVNVFIFLEAKDSYDAPDRGRGGC